MSDIKNGLWLTTPIGTIARGLDKWAEGYEGNRKVFAEQLVDDFLYDLSADGPVVVIQGDTRRVRAVEADGITSGGEPLPAVVFVEVVEE